MSEVIGLEVTEGQRIRGPEAVEGQGSLPPWDSTLTKGSNRLMLTRWPPEKQRHLVPCWSTESSWPKVEGLEREGEGPCRMGAVPREDTPRRRSSSEGRGHDRHHVKGQRRDIERGQGGMNPDL